MSKDPIDRAAKLEAYASEVARARLEHGGRGVTALMEAARDDGLDLTAVERRAHQLEQEHRARLARPAEEIIAEDRDLSEEKYEGWDRPADPRVEARAKALEQARRDRGEEGPAGAAEVRSGEGPRSKETPPPAAEPKPKKRPAAGKAKRKAPKGKTTPAPARRKSTRTRQSTS